MSMHLFIIAFIILPGIIIGNNLHISILFFTRKKIMPPSFWVTGGPHEGATYFFGFKIFSGTFHRKGEFFSAVRLLNMLVILYIYIYHTVGGLLHDITMQRNRPLFLVTFTQMIVWPIFLLFSSTTREVLLMKLYSVQWMKLFWS